MRIYLKLCLTMAMLLNYAATTCAQTKDQRDILNGYSIYDNGYVDQPYVVVLKDGRWLCVFTTGAGTESMPGQHIVARTSKNQGKTWSEPVAIEPSTGPAASWATPYLTSFGRVYVFYDYNGDHINTLNGKPIRHNSEMGWYCYKYSDDNGLTWSKRYRLPMPKAPVDFKNDFKGEVQLFWGIDKPKDVGDYMIFGFTRLGKYIQSDGEGWFYKSANINTEKNADLLKWELLPDGDKGLRNPKYNSIQEEHNTVPLNSGGLYCMYRTTEGFPAHSYSRDGGHTWTMPEAATYTPGGQVFKNPRACARVFKCANGKYVFWYHNHGGKGYKERNPAWISGGVEKEGFIHWSQPEIVVFADEYEFVKETGKPYPGMSYPDLIEYKGKFWVTETQKTKARVHPIDAKLLEGMWNQAEASDVTKKGKLLDKSDVTANSSLPIKSLPSLKEGGLSIEMQFQLEDLKNGQILFDSRDESGRGILIETKDDSNVGISITDGSHTKEWMADPGLVSPGKTHHVVFIVDGAPDIISVIVDGKLCDGGTSRQFGWGKFNKELVNVNGKQSVDVAKSIRGELKNLRIYGRYLTTSEAISNYRSTLNIRTNAQ